MISLLTHEFLKTFDGGIAYSELPFMAKESCHDWSGRIDGYLANDAAGYLVEAKGLGVLESRLELVEADLQRICHQKTRESFIEMGKVRNYRFPSNIFGLVIADCWNPTIAEKWEENGAFDSDSEISKLSRRRFKVAGDFGNYDYFILVGQTPPLNWTR